MAEWRQSCCNPFNKVHHTVRKKSQLRAVTKQMCKKVPSMLPGEKICHTCRKQVSGMSEPTESEKSQSRSFIEEQPSPYNQEYPEIELGQEPTMTDSSSDSDSSSSSDSSLIKQYLTTESRTRVNDYLKVAGETPITKRKLQSKKYKKRKFHTIVKMMERVGIDEKPMQMRR